MNTTGVALELLDHGVAQRTLRQHALNSFFQSTLRETLLHLAKRGFIDTARVTRVTVILFVFGLVTRHTQFFNVDNNNEITGIDMRGVLRLMLATQAARNFTGVNDEPVALDFMRLGGERFPLCTSVAPETARNLEKRGF